MNTYIIISIVVLGIIALLLVVMARKREKAKFTPLAGLAFAFILLGMFFGESRILGYILIFAGVTLAIVDIIIGLRNR